MIEIIDYSAYSIAVFGDTKIIKDKLKELGGRYNPYLTIRDKKQAGWIFKKDMRDKVQDIVLQQPTTNTTPSPLPKSIPPPSEVNNVPEVSIPNQVEIFLKQIPNQVEIVLKQIEQFKKEMELLKAENIRLKEDNKRLKEENDLYQQMFEDL